MGFPVNGRKKIWNLVWCLEVWWCWVLLMSFVRNGSEGTRKFPFWAHRNVFIPLCIFIYFSLLVNWYQNVEAFCLISKAQLKYRILMLNEWCEQQNRILIPNGAYRRFYFNVPSRLSCKFQCANQSCKKSCLSNPDKIKVIFCLNLIHLERKRLL